MSVPPNVTGAGDLQPMPEALLVAGELRRKAKDMILMAQRLEATCLQPERKGKVSFKFSPSKRKEHGR